MGRLISRFAIREAARTPFPPPAPLRVTSDSPAMAATLAAIDFSVARLAVEAPKRIARKVLRGAGARRDGPFVHPLTAARASDPDPAAGILRLRRLADLVLPHAGAGERAQFCAAMLCLRWRRHHERAPLRLVVDNSASAGIAKAEGR